MVRPKTEFMVGTSGWNYPHWLGTFYPEDWPKSRWFEYYTKRFLAVEINATFYRTFKDQTYNNWRERGPDGFSYALKAPRLITHRKYLKDVDEDIKRFWRSALLLKDKLGLILLQLPHNLPYDLLLVKKTLQAFGDPKKIAVEFRDKKWLTEETKEMLMEVGSVFCIVDSPKIELNDWVTADTAYIRLHGRKHWYAYDYPFQELEEIAGLARRIAKVGLKRICIFFNNDLKGCAPKNAMTLLEILKN